MSDRRKLVWIDRAGAKRLAWLFALLFGAHSIFYPICLKMPGRSYRGPAVPPTGEESALRTVLRETVWHLAGTIGERCVLTGNGLQQAADWLETRLEADGLPVTRQTYLALGADCSNLIVELPGTALRDEIVVIGAHYDSVAGCPGANDNATGVAATRALARVFRDRPTARTLRFVMFANEEPPFFWTEQQGSLVYARACRERGDTIVAMLTPETLGWYSDAKGSQSYPGPFAVYFGTRGNYLAFVSNVSSRHLLRRGIGAFRARTPFPSEGMAVPAAIPGVGWSDHWSFWQAGYPGIMVSDTATFRYPHYHKVTDTPDKIDYDKLARVTRGLIDVVDELAGGAAR